MDFLTLYKEYVGHMNRNHFIELLRKKESGIISLQEHQELLALINENKQFKIISNALSLFESKTSNFNQNDPELTEEELGRLKEKIRNYEGKQTILRSKTLRINRIWLAAACILAIFLIGSWLLVSNKRQKYPDNPNFESVFSTENGSKSTLTLPDGSRVVINSKSKLTYDKSFGENTREVYLEGEAYFDVIRNIGHPFIVHTRTLDIKVLGTAFNVRAYKNETSTAATLVRGAVEVLLKNKNNEKINLAPNEKLVVQNAYPAHDVTETETNSLPQISLLRIVPSAIDSGIIETQWTKNRLTFEQEKLKDMIPILENWYGVKFKISQTPVLQRRFSCTIENEKLVDVLESFRLSSGLRYKIDNDTVTIY